MVMILWCLGFIIHGGIRHDKNWDNNTSIQVLWGEIRKCSIKTNQLMRKISFFTKIFFFANLFSKKANLMRDAMELDFLNVIQCMFSY